jgi:hypothetical protein
MPGRSIDILEAKKKNFSSFPPRPTMTSCSLASRIISEPSNNLLRERTKSGKGNENVEVAGLLKKKSGSGQKTNTI